MAEPDGSMTVEVQAARRHLEHRRREVEVGGATAFRPERA